MKKILVTFLCVASAALMHADSYNQSITAIYGAGNPNTGWAADSGNGITLGLRGKNRDTGATPNIAGVYWFATGLNSGGTRARWNYEFSIDSGTSALSFYDYFLGVDLDPSLGISYTYVNALTAFGDNSYGNSGTPNGLGVEGLASALAGTNFIAQNSQNIVFAGLNPLEGAIYNYELFAVAKGDGVGGARLADVAITVVVPDSGTSAVLLCAGLMGLGLLRRKLA